MSTYNERMYNIDELLDALIIDLDGEVESTKYKIADLLLTKAIKLQEKQRGADEKLEILQSLQKSYNNLSELIEFAREVPVSGKMGVKNNNEVFLK